MSEPAPDRGPARRPRTRKGLVVAAVLVLAGLVAYAGLVSRGSGDGSAPAPATPTPTPLGSMDLSGLPITRGPLCAGISGADVRDALGGRVTGTAHYDSGQRVTMAPGLRDVSHEYDCTYRGAGTEARVWVFAEPVDPTAARGLAAAARTARGCRVVAGGPTFGTPGVTTVCRPPRGTQRAVALHGLFGDAWVSCQLTTRAADVPAATAVRRTEQWCVDVATSVGARP